MSAYENVVKGKLNLKGKALKVQGGAQRKKKRKPSEAERALAAQQALAVAQATGQVPLDGGGGGGGDAGGARQEEEAAEREGGHWTPAERRYHEQLQKLEARRNEKQAAKSHRQKIEDFNKYLGDLTEHHDIPKVGPG